MRWHLAEFAERYHLDLDDLHKITDSLPVVVYGHREYSSHVDEARRYLEHRDPYDVALAALELKLAVPVWSNDNDFRELSLTAYTTAALLRALGM